MSAPHESLGWHTPERVVLGTHNAKKAGELRELLAPYGIALLTLDDVANPLEVEEDGATFADNAQRKACQQARHLRSWVIGEDSGLCVDALDGSPGIYSARFSGPRATDAANNARLLEMLRHVPWEQRGAHYVCHLSLANPVGDICVDCEAICRGRIRFVPAGSNGFGYDPLFEILELHRTFGELGPAVKGVLSHRARAIHRFLPLLHELLLTARV
jgi:XTP/dITP diphosphohydrolase